MSFCTVVNCMDGRVQLPVIHFLQENFGFKFVDVVSEAGPVQYLTAPCNIGICDSIISRVNLSIDAHQSALIAVVAHAECAGNPIDEAEQKEQIKAAVAFLAKSYPDLPVHGLWVDNTWTVQPVCTQAPDT